MTSHPVGNLLIAAGVGLALLGVMISLGAGRLFSFFGRLPGDIRIENEHSTVYIPITSCLVISAAASIILMLLARLR